jgi:ankyrin repeat protein
LKEVTMPEDTLKDKNQALITAVTDRDAAAVTDCLKRGANIHCENDFPLRCAVYLGYTDMTELLLKNGANVHTDANEPLFIAIKARDNELIDLLLSKGADLQAVLNTKKDKLDRESLNIIDGIQSRDAKAASEKRAEELREKARKRPVIRPKFA